MKQNPKTKDVLLKQLSPNEIKTIVSDFYLKSLITQWPYKNYIYDFVSSYII